MTGFAVKLPGESLSASKLGQQSGLQSVGSGVEICCFFEHHQSELQRIFLRRKSWCAAMAEKPLCGSF